MKFYVKVVGGVVVDRIVFDDTPPPFQVEVPVAVDDDGNVLESVTEMREFEFPEGKWYEHAEAQIGWKYRAGKFTEVKPPNPIPDPASLIKETE